MKSIPSETEKKMAADVMPKARIVTEKDNRIRVFLDDREVPGVETVKIETLVGSKGPRVLRLTVCVEAISIEEIRQGAPPNKQTIP